MEAAVEQKPPLFDDILEIVDTLSPDEQEILVSIVRNRLRARRREELVAQVAEAQEEYRRGNYRTGTVEEFLAELDAELRE